MQNRELSWLRFNRRVLEEAISPEVPLFERFFYLSVFTTNLDEFFMVRVGSFHDLSVTGAEYTDNKTGMNAEEVLAEIFDAVRPLYKSRDTFFAASESELATEGVRRLKPEELSEEESELLLNYYKARIEPMLAPQIVNKTHPFPHMENKRLIIAVVLNTKGDKEDKEDKGDKQTESKDKKESKPSSLGKNSLFGMIPFPRDVERLYYLKDGSYILVEDVILYYADQIFKKFDIEEKAVICVTRNADLDTVEEKFEEDEDFLDHISKLIKRQKRLAPVRLEIQSRKPGRMAEYLKKKLSLQSGQVYTCDAPLDISYHEALRENVPAQKRKKLCFPQYVPALPPSITDTSDMMAQVRKQDLLISMPYESIQPLLALIQQASEDSDVNSIYITLYRLADHSRLVESLILAAERGKEVYVFIELRARMDEENNIGWAKRLEESGCRVFYGHLAYKMHAKICLITRRTAEGMEFFTHIGTGNYNEKTARLYTDLSIISSDPEIANDAIRFFQNMMTDNIDDTYGLFWLAPNDFKNNLISSIEKQTQLGTDGKILIKCNSLTDKDVIEAFTRASQAGVRIDLIIRGICCLIPEVKGYTDNIHVRSIVGRFLEHSRAYCFGKGEGTELFIGSGDMMTRSTQRRIELFVPVRDGEIRKRIFKMLEVILKDNVKARKLCSDGKYIHFPGQDNEAPLDSQAYFLEYSGI